MLGALLDSILLGKAIGRQTLRMDRWQASGPHDPLEARIGAAGGKYPFATFFPARFASLQGTGIHEREKGFFRVEPLFQR